MNTEIRTEAPIFLFWEYLLPIFGIFSLQCGELIGAQQILLLKERHKKDA
jgi:hypothetical protein